MNMSFAQLLRPLAASPAGSDVLGVPVPERIERLRDPPTRGRRCSSQSQSQEAGVFRRLADWDDYVIGDTYSAANDGLKGRKVGDIAAERGRSRSTRCSTS